MSTARLADERALDSRAHGLLSIAAGACAAFGWLPPHKPLLLTASLAVILYLVARAGSWRQASWFALVGACAFFAIANFPLASAYTWGGWVQGDAPGPASSSWWLLHGLWLLITIWCALFWTVALLLYHFLRRYPSYVSIPAAALAWSLAAEWLRSVSHWGFEWGFLGFALANASPLRQWASVGGGLLLGVFVIGGSMVVAELFIGSRSHRLRLGFGGAILAVLILAVGPALAPQESDLAIRRRVAAFQFSPSVPAPGTPGLGVADEWFRAVPEVAERGYDLIVLPESISSKAVRLDGSAARKLGSGRQVSVAEWERALRPLFDRRRVLLAVGVEGVEAAETFNTTTVWGPNGLVGWQHKVHLVPFAEYLPRGWGFLGSQALTYYTQGSGYRPIAAGPFQIGGFICQEVQHASTIRELTRTGANLLVSGGNDGVFADRRVALVHHSMARVRATEVGRFIVRTMKSGVSSIIDASGNVIAESPGEGPALLGDRVTLESRRTLWTRLGAWPPLMGSLVLLGAGVFEFLQRRGPRPG